MGQTPHTDHLFNTKSKIEGRCLWQYGKTLRPLGPLPLAQSILIQQDLPFSRRQLPAQRRQQSTFTGTVRPQNTQHFTRPHLKGNVSQHAFRAATNLQVFCTQHQWRPRNNK